MGHEGKLVARIGDMEVRELAVGSMILVLWTPNATPITLQLRDVYTLADVLHSWVRWTTEQRPVT